MLALEVTEAADDAEEVETDAAEDTDEATEELTLDDVLGLPEPLETELLLGVVPTQLVLVPAMTVMGAVVGVR